VCAGNLLVDDIVFADGRTRMGEPGGAMLYTALGAALWGARVGIASVAGSDYPQATLTALEARGVDLSGIKRLGKPGVRTWLLYEKAGRRVVHHLGRPTHEEISPGVAQLVEPLRGARAYHISPIPLVCVRELVEALAGEREAIVSLDPHEPVTEDSLVPWRAVLEGVDAFFPGEDELKLSGLADDPRAVLERLATKRLRYVAFKRGAAGGLLHDRRAKRFFEWVGNESKVVDCTGAGDAFAGGFLAGLLAGGGVEAALHQGAVSASFATDDWGAHALLAATRDQAERRRRAWFGMKAAT
jgi:ribokinase